MGRPGSKQGINTGVGLLHLSRMRKSEKFNSMLNPEEMDKLAEKFRFVGALGHQDWWNLVSWDHPEGLSNLECNFNMQIETEYRQGPWLEVSFYYSII